LEIPPVPSRHAVDHGVNPSPDWAQVASELAGLNVMTAVRQRKALSKDFYWYSPALSDALRDCVADLVVRVSTEDDLRDLAHVVLGWP
jgi:hypothetical protein